MTQFSLGESLTNEEVNKVFSGYKSGLYYSQLNERGSAKGIWKNLKDQGNVRLEVVAEWIMIQNKVEELKQFVFDNFNGTLLETYQRFCKFKIPIENKLSTLFGTFERIKEEKDIENYSLR